ncbi:M20/M25/M40 family metallo-hydrolase [candidate division KSB1 bacterium]|nr:M20/M25/M40 family metallo-hydrolase [candidate division KSB1 bacterium]
MKILKKTLLTTISICMLSIRLFAIDVTIQKLINDVNLDSMMQYARELTGEVNVIVDGEQVQILSRNRNFPGNELAADYIRQCFEEWGYTVVLQDYSTTGRNVIATLPGSVDTNKVIILCAHYDSMPQAAVAPGADDNASGVVAVLEAARILTNWTCDYSIVFALWDEEEYGYWGSQAYMQSFPIDQKEIVSVINLDMIAWDSDDDNVVLVGTGGKGSSKIISDIAQDVNLEYKIGLALTETSIRINSDQTTFHDADQTAIGLHENFFGDTNDFYHEPEDVITHFNADYFQKITQLMVGIAGVIAGLEPDSTVDEPIAEVNTFQLESNYPNPFNSMTTIPVSLQESGPIKIEVYDLLGRVVSVLADGAYEAGPHIFSFNASGLPSGVYTCRVITDTFHGSQKMLLLK